MTETQTQEKPKILIIEHEAHEIEAAKEQLSTDIYDLHFSDNYEDASALIANNQYDAVVTDIFLQSKRVNKNYEHPGAGYMCAKEAHEKGIRSVVILTQLPLESPVVGACHKSSYFITIANSVLVQGDVTVKNFELAVKTTLSKAKSTEREKFIEAVGESCAAVMLENGYH